MISGVVERLRSDHEGLPFTTIHDSLLMVADQEAVAIVGRLMQDEFHNIGLTPRIKQNVG